MIYPFLEHEDGDIHCDACDGNYPIVCVCGGLIHAEFDDISNSSDCTYMLCDICGLNYVIGEK